MSVEIWPPISPEDLKIQEDATQARELTWLLASLRGTLEQLKRGLEDCCALLSPSDAAGSTLVLTTPRNETVKGHTTRVGTRLVRGLVHLRLRTLPPQTLSLDPSRPVRVPALARLDSLLARAVGLCLSLEEHQGQNAPPSAAYLASQLRLLALHIAEAAALVKGPPHPLQHPPNITGVPGSRPSTAASTASSGAEFSRHQHQQHHRQQQHQHQHQQQPPSDTSWTTQSVSLGHFAPPLSRNLSLYVTIQDACLVLYLRALEPADAPVNFGTKLALAIGTTRRLEHDEADRVFAYRCEEEPRMEGGEYGGGGGGSSSYKGDDYGDGDSGGGYSGGGEDTRKEVEVYVREKVRVESADPSLLSLSAKLSALGNTLSLTRRNLAAVMGEEMEE